jgi:hypothetical protein
MAAVERLKPPGVEREDLKPSRVIIDGVVSLSFPFNFIAGIISDTVELQLKKEGRFAEVRR